jgi:hypothetical protein
LKYPADIEAWLELALTVIDYDLSCQDMDAHKEVSSEEREQWMGWMLMILGCCLGYAYL